MPRSRRSRRIVEEYFCFRLNSIGPEGKGTAPAYRGMTHDYITVGYEVRDDGDGHTGPTVILRHGPTVTTLPLVSMLSSGCVVGLRWFFLDSEGRRCAKVYYDESAQGGPRWDSRSALKLRSFSYFVAKRKRRRVSYQHTQRKLEEIFRCTKFERRVLRLQRKLAKMERML